MPNVKRKRRTRITIEYGKEYHREDCPPIIPYIVVFERAHTDRVRAIFYDPDSTHRVITDIWELSHHDMPRHMDRTVGMLIKLPEQ